MRLANRQTSQGVVAAFRGDQALAGAVLDHPRHEQRRLCRPNAEHKLRRHHHDRVAGDGEGEGGRDRHQPRPRGSRRRTLQTPRARDGQQRRNQGDVRRLRQQRKRQQRGEPDLLDRSQLPKTGVSRTR
jgi:hypothetical protein